MLYKDQNAPDAHNLDVGLEGRKMEGELRQWVGERRWGRGVGFEGEGGMRGRRGWGRLRCINEGAGVSFWQFSPL